MNEALVMIHELLCIVLIATVALRFFRTDASVRLDVRFSFFLLGVVACIGVVAPLYGFEPGIFSILLLAVIAVVQVVTSRYWRKGVPLSFYRPDRIPQRRATDMMGGAHGHH